MTENILLKKMSKSKRQWEEQRNLEIALDEQGFYNELMYRERMGWNRLWMMIEQQNNNER